MHPHRPGLAIRCDHPILRLQGQDAGYQAGLLPFHLGIGTETPLTLEGDGFTVVEAQQPHLPVHLAHLLLVQGRPQCLIAGAVRRQNAHHLVLERIVALEEHLLAPVVDLNGEVNNPHAIQQARRYRYGYAASSWLSGTQR